MSWLSENYEKASLGGAILLGAGLAFLGMKALDAVESEMSQDPKGNGSNEASVPNADAVPLAMASIDMKHEWLQGKDPRAREVDLFVGVPLFIKRSEPDKVIDLLKDGPVHPPIKNMWWLDNGLDPGFADSPQRDPDNDGFSNLEEYEYGTDPKNVNDYPPLIIKLKFVKEESVVWVLRPSFAGADTFTFRYLDNKRRANRVGAANPIANGETFFKDGIQKGRFKLVGSGKRMEMDPKMNIEREKTFVKVEDLRPNKLGRVYEYPAPLTQARMNDFREYDRTAVLSLEALDLHGKEFKIEENTSFALPPGPGKKEFLLRTILPEKLVIEYTDAKGVKKTAEILKGGLPNLNP